MSNIQDIDIYGLRYCIEQLFNYILQKGYSESDNSDGKHRYKFRVEISLPIQIHGKKFYIYSKQGKIMLSRREIECLQCLLDGLTAKDTAKLLFLSKRTVETYIANIKYKLDCRKKGEIFKLFYR